MSNPTTTDFATTVGAVSAHGLIYNDVVAIESSGATRLDQVANEFYLRDGAGNGPSLKYAGADVVAGQFGTWTPLGVEKVGSGYQVVWKNGSADQYIVWNVDSNGNCYQQGTGVVSGFGVCVPVAGDGVPAGFQRRRHDRPEDDADRDGGRDASGPGGQRVLPARRRWQRSVPEVRRCRRCRRPVRGLDAARGGEGRQRLPGGLEERQRRPVHRLERRQQRQLDRYASAA